MVTVGAAPRIRDPCLSPFIPAGRMKARRGGPQDRDHPLLPSSLRRGIPLGGRGGVSPRGLCYASANMEWKNKLYFGDNLNILREYVADASVDLIYLDPPFNSSATYNVLFKEK